MLTMHHEVSWGESEKEIEVLGDRFFVSISYEDIADDVVSDDTGRYSYTARYSYTNRRQRGFLILMFLCVCVTVCVTFRYYAALHP
jgi:hypothetical protein